MGIAWLIVYAYALLFQLLYILVLDPRVARDYYYYFFKGGLIVIIIL